MTCQSKNPFRAPAHASPHDAHILDSAPYAISFRCDLLHVLLTPSDLYFFDDGTVHIAILLERDLSIDPS